MRSTTISLAFPQLLATAGANLAVARFPMGVLPIAAVGPGKCRSLPVAAPPVSRWPGQLLQKQRRTSIAHCDCEAAVAKSQAVVLEVVIPCSCGLVGSPFSSFPSDSKLPGGPQFREQLLRDAIFSPSEENSPTVRSC